MVEVEPALAVSDDDIPADWDVEDSTIGIAVLVSTSSVVVDTGTSVEGDSVVLPQHPFFNGRQLVQDRPDFTHEQNLQRALSPLHRQHGCGLAFTAHVVSHVVAIVLITIAIDLYWCIF